MTTYQQYENPLDAPRTCPQKNSYIFFLGYALAGYLFINGVSQFLTVSESALLTISTLTSDLWAVLFTVFAEHILPSALFYGASIFMIVGVLIYEMSPSPLGPAEDMQIHNDFEIERHVDAFDLSNMSMSWENTETKDSKLKEIV